MKRHPNKNNTQYYLNKKLKEFYRTSFMNNRKKSMSEDVQPGYEKDKTTKVDDGKTPIKWTDKANTISTIVVAITTVILAWFTYGLFVEATKQSTNTKVTVDMINKFFI